MDLVKCMLKFGAPDENRTHISSLEGWSTNHCATGAYWSGRPGSNRRPRPWQGRALPTELLPPLILYISISVKFSKWL